MFWCSLFCFSLFWCSVFWCTPFCYSPFSSSPFCLSLFCFPIQLVPVLLIPVLLLLVLLLPVLLLSVLLLPIIFPRSVGHSSAAACSTTPRSAIFCSTATHYAAAGTLRSATPSSADLRFTGVVFSTIIIFSDVVFY